MAELAATGPRARHPRLRRGGRDRPRGRRHAIAAARRDRGGSALQLRAVPAARPSRRSRLARRLLLPQQRRRGGPDAARRRLSGRWRSSTSTCTTPTAPRRCWSACPTRPCTRCTAPPARTSPGSGCARGREREHSSRSAAAPAPRDLPRGGRRAAPTRSPGLRTRSCCRSDTTPWRATRTAPGAFRRRSSSGSAACSPAPGLPVCVIQEGGYALGSLAAVQPRLRHRPAERERGRRERAEPYASERCASRDRPMLRPSTLLDAGSSRSPPPRRARRGDRAAARRAVCDLPRDRALQARARDPDDAARPRRSRCARATSRAAPRSQLPADFTAELFELLIAATCRMEDELIAPGREGAMTRPTFITLGPSGTCHENALLHYLEFQGIAAYEIVLVEDLLGGIERVRGRPDTFLVQCSAHVQVHLVTERYHTEVFVIDTFLYPTKELALLVRADVADPRSLGIVSATRGYTDLDALADDHRRAVQAGRRAPPARGRLRRRPHAPALCARTPRRAARAGGLRRGGHDLGRVRRRASASAARSSASATRGCSRAARAGLRLRSVARAPGGPAVGEPNRCGVAIRRGISPSARVVRAFGRCGSQRVRHGGWTLLSFLWGSRVVRGVTG